jgi:hypothetical protein
MGNIVIIVFVNIKNIKREFPRLPFYWDFRQLAKPQRTQVGAQPVKRTQNQLSHRGGKIQHLPYSRSEI